MRVYTITPVADRFWRHVDKSGDCWVWTGSRFKNGYGRMELTDRTPRHFKAHRLAYELHHGPIPDGLWVLHRCDNRACVRPDHLFLGTHEDNMEDMRRKGRQARGERHGLVMQPERQARGERHGSAKLTTDDVLAIRTRYAAGGIRQRDIAAEYGLSQGTVGAILRREIWQHVGG